MLHVILVLLTLRTNILCFWWMITLVYQTSNAGNFRLTSMPGTAPDRDFVNEVWCMLTKQARDSPAMTCLRSLSYSYLGGEVLDVPCIKSLFL
jgi:hypothetical protein